MTTYTIQTEDEEEHRNFLNGPMYKSMLIEILNYFRSKSKYQENEIWIEAYKAIYEITGDIFE